MLRLLPVVITAVVASALVADVSAAKPTADELLEKAIYTEQAVGDLDAAIKLYEQVVAEHEQNAAAAARAQLRIGLAHLKQGDRVKASKAFRVLLEKYPAQKRLAEQARNLMPAAIDEAMRQIRKNYVDVLDNEDELMAAAIRGVLGELDQHSGFLSAEAMGELEVSIKGELVGVGIAIALKEGELVVTTPIYGSPAHEAGLRAGDVLTAFDGTTVASLPEETRLREAVRRLRGKTGTTVMVDVLSPEAEKPREVRIVRRPITLESVAGNQRFESGKWNYELSDNPLIGYVRLLSFSRDTPQTLRAVVSDLQQRGMKALVIDLRNTPGGSLTSCVDCADMFLTEGVILEVKGRNNQDKTLRAKPPELLAGMPLAILTNAKTASAAEIFAGALRDHKRAVVVGERTFGKGTIQALFRLRSGSALKLTTARFYLPSGVSLQKPPTPDENDTWGVNPSEGFQVELTEEETLAHAEDRAARDVVGGKHESDFADRVLEKAVSHLKEQL